MERRGHNSTKKKKKQTYFEANQDTRCHNVGVFATGETEGWGLGGSWMEGDLKKEGSGGGGGGAEFPGPSGYRINWLAARWL